MGLLGGGKAEVAAVQERMGPACWARLLTVCEQTMARAFPGALSASLDVLVEPDFRTVRVLEVNAFGDLLPRLLHEGRDTYSWEVLAANGAAPAQVSATGASRFGSSKPAVQATAAWQLVMVGGTRTK